MILGSLSKHDVDGSENVIWKCNFAFLQSFLNYSVILLAKCVLTILELNWNQRFIDKKTKLNICQHTLTSSTQLQNRSFLVVERTRTSAKCPKTIVFHCQICKFGTFLLPSSSWYHRLVVVYILSILSR